MVFDQLLHLDDLHRWRACERQFWLHRQPSPEAGALTFAASVQADADESAEAAVVYGPALQAALRASFPGATTISAPTTPHEWVGAVRQTLDCLDSDQEAAEGWAIFGACLTSDDRAQVRIDVMSLGEHGLRLFKVRHATVGDEADVDAMALWLHVASRCGLRVQSVALLLVDTDFIYPGHGCYAGLFREVDLAPVLGSRPVGAWLSAMRRADRGPEPAANPGAHCGESGGSGQRGGCDFADACLACAKPPPEPLPDRLASLNIVGRELAAELRHEGHLDLRSVAPQALSNARHRRAVRAIQQGAPVLEPAVAALFRDLPYPRYSLRFDTIGFAVPVWADTRPYQTLPFQWTCDVQSAAGHCVQHGFLADAKGDPRRAFAVTLLQVLGSSGPVFACNAGFERSRIRELALQFEDLAPALEDVLARIVDLFQIARAHYYHPVMGGSWSFKSLGRAVAPELLLNELDSVQAASAQAAFARSLQPGLDHTIRQQLRAALQAHGQRQTEVLRRMLALFEGVGATQSS
jgi:hypothetical protein